MTDLCVGVCVHRPKDVYSFVRRFFPRQLTSEAKYNHNTKLRNELTVIYAETFQYMITDDCRIDVEKIQNKTKRGLE